MIPKFTMLNGVIFFASLCSLVGLTQMLFSATNQPQQPPPLPIKRNLVDQPGFTNTFNGTNAVITSIRMVSAEEFATNCLWFSNRLCLVIDGKVKAFAINPSEWGTLLNDKRLSKTNFQTKTIRIQLP